MNIYSYDMFDGTVKPGTSPDTAGRLRVRWKFDLRLSG
jgi:hypothetical protein